MYGFKFGFIVIRTESLGQIINSYGYLRK